MGKIPETVASQCWSGSKVQGTAQCFLPAPYKGPGRKGESTEKQGDHTTPFVAIAAGGETRGSSVYFGKSKQFFVHYILVNKNTDN